MFWRGIVKSKAHRRRGIERTRLVCTCLSVHPKRNLRLNLQGVARSVHDCLVNSKSENGKVDHTFVSEMLRVTSGAASAYAAQGNSDLARQLAVFLAVSPHLFTCFCFILLGNNEHLVRRALNGHRLKADHFINGKRTLKAHKDRPLSYLPPYHIPLHASLRTVTVSTFSK